MCVGTRAEWWKFCNWFKLPPPSRVRRRQTARSRARQGTACGPPGPISNHVGRESAEILRTCLFEAHSSHDRRTPKRIVRALLQACKGRCCVSAPSNGREICITAHTHRSGWVEHRDCSPMIPRHTHQHHDCASRKATHLIRRPTRMRALSISQRAFSDRRGVYIWSGRAGKLCPTRRRFVRYSNPYHLLALAARPCRRPWRTSRRSSSIAVQRSRRSGWVRADRPV